MRRPETIKELLKYRFTPDELASLSEKMARAFQERDRAEEEKKAAMASFKDRIERHVADCRQYSRLVSNGFDMREVECTIRYNVPVMGTKQIINPATEEVIRELAMTPGEYQGSIEFVGGGDEDRLAERKALEEQERRIREWFNKPDQPSLIPIDVSALTSFRSGDYIIAAEDLEAAILYARGPGFPTEVADKLAACDPDETSFAGFEELYGDASRTCRQAIAILAELGKEFPILLAFPHGIAPQAEREAGEDVGPIVDAGTPEDFENPEATTDDEPETEE